MEWHARELEHYVKYLGFSPAETLRCATVNNGTFVRENGEGGLLDPGKLADILVVDGDPLENLSLLCNDGESISGIIANGIIIKNEIN